MVFITSQSISAEILRQQNLAKEISAEQSKVSSGVKITKSSDNPQDWVQISELGRQQSMNLAWTSNINYAQSRAAQATSSLNDLNGLMSRMTELLVQATSTSESSPGREAIAQELEGIRSSVTDILNQTNYQGTPVFDDTTSVDVPVGTGPFRASGGDEAEHFGKCGWRKKHR